MTGASTALDDAERAVILGVAVEAAVRAGAVLMEHFGALEAGDVTTKSSARGPRPPPSSAPMPLDGQSAVEKSRE